MTMEASVKCFYTGMLYRAGQGQARQVTHTKYSKQVKFGNCKAHQMQSDRTAIPECRLQTVC